MTAWRCRWTRRQAAVRRLRCQGRRQRSPGSSGPLALGTPVQTRVQAALWAGTPLYSWFRRLSGPELFYNWFRRPSGSELYSSSPVGWSAAFCPGTCRGLTAGGAEVLDCLERPGNRPASDSELVANGRMRVWGPSCGLGSEVRCVRWPAQGALAECQLFMLKHGIGAMGCHGRWGSQPRGPLAHKSM
jgi:hypothetical protein